MYDTRVIKTLYYKLSEAFNCPLSIVINILGNFVACPFNWKSLWLLIILTMYSSKLFIGQQITKPTLRTLTSSSCCANYITITDLLVHIAYQCIFQTTLWGFVSDLLSSILRDVNHSEGSFLTPIYWCVCVECSQLFYLCWIYFGLYSRWYLYVPGSPFYSKNIFGPRYCKFVVHIRFMYPGCTIFYSLFK